MNFLSFLSQEIYRIFLSTVLFLLIGSITGSWLFSLCLVVFCYIIWLYLKIFQLSVWLENDLNDSNRPVGDGVWERLTFLIHQTDKKSKSRKAKTNILLKHFQGVVKGLPFATIVLNSNNEIEWSNSMASKLLKIMPKGDRGNRIDNLLRDPKFHKMLLEQPEHEVEMTSPHDSKIALSFRILPIQINSKLLIVRDISERTRLMERQKTFVDNASHELKTPLTSIYGYIDIMRSNKNIGYDEKEMLDEAFKQTQSMVELIDDLLFLSKVESESSLRSLFEAVSMESVINKSIVRLTNVDTAIEKGFYIDAIKIEIKSLVKNIIDNAIKHNPEGTKIEVKWYMDKSGRPCLEVRDYGRSIPQKDLAYVTEKFYRVSDESFQSSGSGLGLSIVKSIAERHDAEMQIISKKDFGTAVIIQFPTYRILQSAE